MGVDLEGMKPALRYTVLTVATLSRLGPSAGLKGSDRRRADVPSHIGSVGAGQIGFHASAFGDPLYKGVVHGAGIEP
jgi:hypothetical protein